MRGHVVGETDGTFTCAYQTIVNDKEKKDSRVQGEGGIGVRNRRNRCEEGREGGRCGGGRRR